MADREIISQKSSAMPTSSVDANVASRSIPNSDDISRSVWQERLNLLKKPRVLISLFLASSALYCFVIGRDRYISVSEFVIQQAVPLNTSSASVLAGAAAAPASMPPQQLQTSAKPGPPLARPLGAGLPRTWIQPLPIKVVPIPK